MSVPGTRPSAISRIRALLTNPTHHYRPATTIFLDLSIDRLAEEFRLAARGDERGSENRPTSDAQAPDDVEHQIIERVEAHKQDANVLYLDHLHTYDERLNALSFEERFAIIQQAAPEAVGDFRAEATVGRDELFVLRRRLNESEIDREQFRKYHRIARPARLASPGKIILKIGVLAVLFIIEVMVNGSFLAKANVGGLLGGAAQAVTFAALNILASFFWGMALIRLVNRRNYVLKLIGTLSFLAYLAFAVVLNLTLSHLREIPPVVALSDNVGQEVLRRLLAAPLGLTDINSWILFSIGIVFSLIAMADGLTFFDPYPGYAGLDRRWIEATRQFSDTRSELIERLRDIREDATEAMNEAARDLSVRRSEYDSLVQGRLRLTQRFDQHQNQIEQAGRALLEIYREANRRTRSTPAPAYFANAFRMDRISYTGNEPSTSARENLRAMIAATQQLLSQQIKAIHEAFDQAVRTYREIDELLPEKKSG